MYNPDGIPRRKAYLSGKPEGHEDVPINHNGLDNRKANLRLASNAQNSWNKRKQRGKHSSKYKGVCWSKVKGKWQARIQVNGKGIFLGAFEDEVEAARAYDAAARKYYGDFAYLNFPTGP